MYINIIMWREKKNIPGATMVAAEGTIKSFRFGSAFSGFTAQRLIERFKAAGDAT